MACKLSSEHIYLEYLVYIYESYTLAINVNSVRNSAVHKEIELSASDQSKISVYCLPILFYFWPMFQRTAEKHNWYYEHTIEDNIFSILKEIKFRVVLVPWSVEPNCWSVSIFYL